MLASGLAFTIMSVFVKKLAPVIPQFELVFFRSFINFLIVLPVMLVRKENLWPPGKPLLVFRGAVGFGGVSCLFYGLAHLPLPVASMINWSSPIFVLLFSRILLKERVGKKALMWIGLAFGGFVLLMRPDLGEGEFSLPLVAVGVAVLGSAFGAMAYVAVRAATARVGVNAIVLYFTGVASLLSAPLAWSQRVHPTGDQWLQLIWLGTFAGIGQFAMTQGYRYAAAGLVSTMGLMNAGFAALFGWLVFGELLSPVQWMGMALLATGVGLVTLHSGGGGKPERVAAATTTE